MKTLISFTTRWRSQRQVPPAILMFGWRRQVRLHRPCGWIAGGFSPVDYVKALLFLRFSMGFIRLPDKTKKRRCRSIAAF